MKQLAAVLSADPAPAHPAALLRVIGSHNSKYGEPIEVRALYGSGEPVDLTEIESLIDALPATGLFARKERVAQGNGHAVGATEWKPPLDAYQRLADVAIGDPVAGVHTTELVSMASLLRRGMSLPSAVLTVLEELQKSLSRDPRADNWNWDKDQIKLEGQEFHFISKHPELSTALPEEFQDAFENVIRSGKRGRFVYNRAVRRWHMRALGVVEGGLASKEPGDGSPDESQRNQPKTSRSATASSWYHSTT